MSAPLRPHSLSDEAHVGVSHACSTQPPALRPAVTVPEGPINDKWDYQRGQYNRVYGDSNQTIFVTTPSEFLMDCVHELPQGPGSSAKRAIDLGAGQGRNSIPLAEAGYAVTAIDFSALGLAHLRIEAESRRLVIEILEADACSATLEPESVDLVVAIYINLPEGFIDGLQKAIKPGGAIIIEGYPSDAPPCDVPLPDRFLGWQIVKYETGDAEPEWYWHGERRAVPVVRFCACKPVKR